MTTRDAYAMVLLVLANSLASAAPSPPLDASLDKAMFGAWCSSEDGGKTCWGYDQFDSGIVRSCGRFSNSEVDFFVRSRYIINGTKVCYTIAQSTLPEILKIGQRFCEDVLQIDFRTRRVRDLESNEESVSYRTNEKTVKCAQDGK